MPRLRLEISGAQAGLEPADWRVTVVEGLRWCWPDRDPGQGRICSGRGEGGGGEKGTDTAGRDSPVRQHLASYGVRNHLSRDTSSGKATVWSGTVSLAANLEAWLRKSLATARHCSAEVSGSPTSLRGLEVKVIWPEAKE